MFWAPVPGDPGYEDYEREQRKLAAAEPPPLARPAAGRRPETFEDGSYTVGPFLEQGGSRPFFMLVEADDPDPGAWLSDPMLVEMRYNAANHCMEREHWGRLGVMARLMLLLLGLLFQAAWPDSAGQGPDPRPAERRGSRPGPRGQGRNLSAHRSTGPPVRAALRPALVL